MPITREQINNCLDQKLKTFSPEILEKCKELMDKVFIQKIPLKEALLNEVLGLPKEVHKDLLNFLYDHAYSEFQLGKFPDARILFEFLHHLDNSNPYYTFAIATCFHREKKYIKAIEMYTFTTILDQEIYMAFYYMSDCFIQLNQPETAIKMLLQLAKRTAHNPFLKHIHQQVEETIKNLQEELENKYR